MAEVKRPPDLKMFSLHFITSQADAKPRTTSINEADGNRQFQNQSITEVPQLSII